MPNSRLIEKLALDQIIALLPGHVYWKNIEGKYLGCNELQAKTLGLKSREKIVDKLPYSDLPEKIANELRKSDKNLIENGKPMVQEEIGIREDGSLGTFLSHKIPLFGSEGKVVGILGVSLDITDKKEAEEQLKKTNKIISQSNFAKKSFIESIGQEIRIPLNNILGTAQLLEKKANKEEDLEKFKLIEESAKSIIPILDRVNYYLDLNDHSKKIFREKLNLKFLINSIITDNDTVIAEKKAKIAFSFDKNLPLSMKNDVGLLIEVLHTVFGNALHFIGDNGKINISCRLSGNITEDVVSVLITVEDNGLGIAENKLSNIFNFFDFDNFDKNKEIFDSGIKLSIVKKIMELLGGNIEIKSRQKHGTKVILSLPFVVVHEALKNKSSEIKPGEYNDIFQEIESEQRADAAVFKHFLKVLLIEDHPLNAKVMKWMLEGQFNCIVDTANCGRDGIEKSINNKYDLIFCDIGLPDESGVTVAKKIVNHFGENRPELIGITAHLREKEIESYYAAGFLDVLPKPITLEMLNLLFSTIWLDKSKIT